MRPDLTSDQDRALWRMAKARAGFKMHALVYVLVNTFLWLLWAFTDNISEPWPIFTTLGWGVGLLANYISAYYRNTLFSPEAEYERLKRG